VRALIADAAVPLVCEPLEAKLKPATSYSAQFSLPYSVACSLMRGKFGLNEIEAPTYTDAAILKLAQKVKYEIDPNPGFPKFRSGEVIVRLKDGRELRERDNILPDEPASADEIVAKFMQNTDGVVARAQAERIRDTVLGLERVTDVNELMALLGGSTPAAVRKAVNA
jgi:2-methylcitrate dehydratase PrpD